MYTLFRSESPGVPLGGPGVIGIVSTSDRDSLFYEDADVEWDTKYYYALLTLDSEGMGSWSAENYADTPDFIPTASLLHLDSLYINWAALSWSICPDGDFFSYEVYSSETPGIEEAPDAAYLLEVIESPYDTTIVDTSFVFGPVYYAIRTENSFGVTTWSNEVVAEFAYPPFPWRIVFNTPWEGYIGSVAIACDGSVALAVNETLCEVALGAMPPRSLATFSAFPVPSSVCTSPDDSCVLIACSFTGVVEIYGLDPLIPLDTLYLGGSPSSIASAPSGEHAYCGCLQSGKLYAIHVNDAEITSEAEPGDGPAGIACHTSGDRLFVSCRYGDRLAAYSCPDLEPLFSTEVGDGPGPVSVSCDGTRVYVGCEAGGSVWVLSSENGEVLHVLHGVGRPAGMTEIPNGSLLYVSDAESGRIVLYRTDDWEQILEIDTGDGAGELRCSPDGEWVVAGGGGGCDLLVVGL